MRNHAPVANSGKACAPCPLEAGSMEQDCASSRVDKESTRTASTSTRIRDGGEEFENLTKNRLRPRPSPMMLPNWGIPYGSKVVGWWVNRFLTRGIAQYRGHEASFLAVCVIWRPFSSKVIGAVFCGPCGLQVRSPAKLWNRSSRGC